MPETVCYRAAWVFPVLGPPIADGVVEVRDSLVVDVYPAAQRSATAGKAIDLNDRIQSDAILLPGLVNAHTHLEFSQLEQPLGEAGGRLTDWIPEVIRWRRSRDESDPNAKAAAIAQGTRESLAAGVANLGEIATAPWSRSLHPTPTPRCTAFLELIAFSDADNQRARDLAFAHLDPEQPRDDRLTYGLSPHAPYTVNLELLEDAVDLSHRTGAPLQMHLAESLEELEYIGAATGPFRDMLERVGVWDEAKAPRGLRPLDYLERLAQASRVVIAHGNYLTPQEIRFLGEHASDMAVAFCPRTHNFFGHGEYPLSTMLADGVTLALGTDSRASNPDLSILAEMRWLADRQLASPTDILRMGALNGAEALGDTLGGAIAPQRRADFALLSSPPMNDPYEALFSAETTVRGLSLSGQWIDGDLCDGYMRDGEASGE